MGELYELYPKLPKNIRQIGERDTVLRLYVEDYVNGTSDEKELAARIDKLWREVDWNPPS